MRTNVVFTSYRRQTSGSERIYNPTAQITNGVAFLHPLDGQMKAILGLDLAVRAFSLTSNYSQFEKYDKVVVSSPTELAGDYFVEGIELSSVNGMIQSSITLKKDE